MFDIGWPELMLIALVTILVVGPKEIPHVLRTVTGFMRKLRGMASEFQNSIDDLAREAELDDLKKNIEKTASGDLAGDLEKSFDPTGDVKKSIAEMESSVTRDPRTEPAPAEPAAKPKPKPKAAKTASSGKAKGGKGKDA